MFSLQKERKMPSIWDILEKENIKKTAAMQKKAVSYDMITPQRILHTYSRLSSKGISEDS